MLRFSDCKINVGLDIVGRRPDGYHDLVTVMMHVPWHDAVEVLPATGSDNSLKVYGRPVPCAPENNLVMKAARAMQKAYSLPAVDLVLQKNIPDGAGLGAGSADAATTILLLNDFFSLGLPKEEMARLAAGIGADCPFFIYSETMLATGTGTQLQPYPLDLSGYVLAITKPEGMSISTRQAYAGVKPMCPVEDLAQLLRLPVKDWMGRVKNDFEASIFPIAPAIERVKEDLLGQGAIYASMTGSGAAVYGIFEPPADGRLDIRADAVFTL